MKLIPSVIGMYEMNANEVGRPQALTWQGPTRVYVRSAYDDSTSPATHSADLLDCFKTENPEEMKVLLDAKELGVGTRKPRPVLLVGVDGGPDENPRFPNTIAHYVHLFKELDLDLLVCSTHAPGWSAYNRVERRMAPLSLSMCGLVLSMDKYGNHLNGKYEVVDPELCRKNMRSASDVLADTYSRVTISNRPVTAKAVSKEEVGSAVSDVPPFVYDKWAARHVRVTRYMCQISKCLPHEECESCNPVGVDGVAHSTRRCERLQYVLPDKFIPPPRAMAEDGTLDVSHSPEHFLTFHSNVLWGESLLHGLRPEERCPDMYCPAGVFPEKRGKLMCNECGAFFVTQRAVLEHRKHVHRAQMARRTRSQPVRIPPAGEMDGLVAEGPSPCQATRLPDNGADSGDVTMGDGDEEDGEVLVPEDESVLELLGLGSEPTQIMSEDTHHFRVKCRLGGVVKIDKETLFEYYPAIVHTYMRRNHPDMYMREDAVASAPTIDDDSEHMPPVFSMSELNITVDVPHLDSAFNFTIGEDNNPSTLSPDVGPVK